MSSKRIDKVNSLLKEVISEVIARDVRNPRVNTLVTVLGVSIAKDLHNATVYISVIGSEQEKQETLAALQSAAGFISVHASKKVTMRYFPSLIFSLDSSIEEHLKIHEILEKIHDENNLARPILPMNEGILLVDKPKGKTSFSLVSALRRKTGIQKIGHAGTLDPFATGLMIMLIGKTFTRLSDQYLIQEKEYECTVRLGITTDTYDCEGKVVQISSHIPSLSDIETSLTQFNGTILQIPPMFSAKKIKGKKLYELARKGISVERAPVSVTLKTTLISYTYPHLKLHIVCSKGTYIRSLAYDLGTLLTCGAHLDELRRLRSGSFSIDQAINGALLYADH